ncbi:methylmalonyl-CoA decarboxylase [Nocardia sp. NPDC127526]|uniref:methylmalonyl-CoA decarboxylase n=1 Tax=Nocardia sp. NPDC127526 TaxID=3345393 RepID=UPI003637D5BF
MRRIQTSVTGGVGTIAFDDYSSRNALSTGLVDQALSALTLMQEEGVRAIVLRSAVRGRVWSAGCDAGELPAPGTDPSSHDDPVEALVRAVRRCHAPVIAMVDGAVRGGACDLVVNCDLVIADENATFAVVAGKLGLPYRTVDLMHFLARLPQGVVKEMFFTATPLGALRAYELGLINELMPADVLEEYVYALAELIETRAPQTISAMKATINELAEAVPLSPQVHECLDDRRSKVYRGPEYREGVEAFRTKRAPVF